MSNYMDFTSTNPNVNVILVDKSGSMSGDRERVLKGLEGYRRNFLEFPEAGSIAVSICTFSDYVELGDFNQVREMERISYHPNGGTALNYAIITAANHLVKYMEEIEKVKKCSPVASFIVFSDGEPCGDKNSDEEGEAAIDELNFLGVNTIFVPFGKAIKEEYGAKKGFKATRQIGTGEEAVEFFAEELSRFSKEQSKLNVGIGQEFFSKTGESKTGNSSNYSNTANQALKKDAWWNKF